MSYNNLNNEETKSVLLLCGLFPNNFDIPVEDLMRYGWGLKLFKRVYTIREARHRLKTCVDRLIRSSLLIESHRVGCVKLHDLVLSFVLGVYDKVKHTLIVNHHNMFEWPRKGTSDSYERISLTCIGMSEFPRDFVYPNLKLLKLMHGDESLVFSHNLYEKTENLEVISYEKLHYPLFPRSLQCSTNLRTLCLRQCLLMFDYSPIGDLLNLEVLSLAHCNIRKLPSTIGNLKVLKLLDLTGCVDLRIDDGILKKLVKLEELYMRVSDQKAIQFTNSNCTELAERSMNLFSLELEFFENHIKAKNVSFKKLERFKISIGCYLKENSGENMNSFENTLMLETNKDDLLESKINKLFQKTEVLRLKVNDMDHIEDILVQSLHPPQYSFSSLRVLDVFQCEHLRFLFTVRVANGLTKLERLTVSFCPVLEVLIYIENSGDETITFQKLKFLSLDGLPKLVSLCNTSNIILLPELVELRLDGLPNFTSIYPENEPTAFTQTYISTKQPFLNKEVEIPKIKKLEIGSMDNLTEIWPCQIRSSHNDVNVCTLPEIIVRQCNSLLNLFPNNYLPFLHHLEELRVVKCDSIEVVFNIDMKCATEVGECTSNLRYIVLEELGKLRDVWRVIGVSVSNVSIHGFQAVEGILIVKCNSFRNIFTPVTANFDMRSLTHVEIHGHEDWGNVLEDNESVESTQEEAISFVPKEDISELDANISDVALSSHLIHILHKLQSLYLANYKGVEVVFEIESASSTKLATTRDNQQRLILPYLKYFELKDMERMTHVWKCNWNKFFILRKHLLESSFHNVTNISVYKCKRIKYLFSPLMVTLLHNLKSIYIFNCDGFEEVVSDRDDKDGEIATSTSLPTNTTFFPHLDTLELGYLRSLWGIGGGGNRTRASNVTTTTSSVHDQLTCPQVVASWSLCQYPRKIKFFNCDALSYAIPSNAVGQLLKLEKLKVSLCPSMIQLFEGLNNDRGQSSYVGSRIGVRIPRLTNMTTLKLLNLKILHIKDCDHLDHIFTFSILESIKQLKELKIKRCWKMQVIVKEEDEEQTTSKVVIFPCLKSLTLVDLPNLKGFFLGMNEFRFPLLNKVKIYDCPQMMAFTCAKSTAPQLNRIHTGLGKHNLECGLNFRVLTTLHQTRFPCLESTSSCPTLERMPWSFANLIEMDIERNDDIKKIISFNALPQLQKLEKVHLKHCYRLEEVFEASKGRNSGLNESPSTLKFPKLKEVDLVELYNLKYIWKSNQWTELEFPNLTRVSLHRCTSIKDVFTRSMVGSLVQLKELHVSHCKNMEVIVKEDNFVLEEGELDIKVNKITLPCLKSLNLEELPSLIGFSLGNDGFSWPSLDTLEIKECPKIVVFTNGCLVTPELKLIGTTFGLCYVDEDLNEFIKTKRQEGFEF